MNWNQRASIVIFHFDQHRGEMQDGHSHYCVLGLKFFLQIEQSDRRLD
jgi:hypothetical protein